jgi:creatinine amidohydrolase/Fe(II)-dependent formamide hydrolase-like protein/GNAT superfamily N-acetyltransferase
MIDGTHTTFDWQRHPTDILVLPVGAFEQHSVHLPLDTDSIQVNFFARMVAEALDAALLPTLHIATSLEHSGFRGTFSLRPETLMQVVRDIADEAERQGFRFIVLMNGHGGNFALVPACRDINRLDRALKIIPVDYWLFEDRPPLETAGRKGPNFHSGEIETSIMLVLRPDLVREARADARYPDEPCPLAQPDLTAFGVGHLVPEGAVGWPSFATKAKGEAAIASVRQHLIPHLRDRIERLRRQPRYAGGGGLAIRRMIARDIPEAMRLKQIAGWNQVESDWTMFLESNPDGCFVMVHQGRVVGTVTACNYANAAAWIGMLLVDPAFRRLGIATRLLNHALDALGACGTVKLDATPEGKPVYEKLGFAAQYAIRRLCVRALPPPGEAPARVEPLREADLEAVLAADRAVFGADRSAVLRALWRRAPQLGRKLAHGSAIRAYCFGRDGSSYTQIGPVVADSAEEAFRLARGAMAALGGQPVLLDVTDAQREFRGLLAGIGFGEQRAFLRMARGSDPHAGDARRQFAIGGPEIG